ncbi:MAG: hypothetical protein WAQ25_02855 [Candidatus Saccharimonas sp.]
MSKKLFKKLIKKASQPVEKDREKSVRSGSGDYSGKRTPQGKAEDTSLIKRFNP